jgi:hypothetical protein
MSERFSRWKCSISRATRMANAQSVSVNVIKAVKWFARVSNHKNSSAGVLLGLLNISDWLISYHNCFYCVCNSRNQRYSTRFVTRHCAGPNENDPMCIAATAFSIARLSLVKGESWRSEANEVSPCSVRIASSASSITMRMLTEAAASLDAEECATRRLCLNESCDMALARAWQ